jgi:hypothetical protein
MAGPDDEWVEAPTFYDGRVTHNGGSKRGRKMHGSMYGSGTYSCEKTRVSAKRLEILKKVVPGLSHAAARQN